MNRVLYFIKNFGIFHDTPLSQIRSIRLLTYISFTAVFTALFYSILFLFLGETVPAVLDLMLVILFIPSMVLIRLKKHHLAKYLLIINANVAILLVIVVYGQQYRNELFYIVSSALGIILFREKKHGLISFILAISFFLFTKIYLRNVQAIHPTEESLTYPLAVIGLISICIIVCLLILYIKNETLDYEGKIISALNNLDEKKNYILDSLNYAASIQMAVFGSKSQILKHFKEGFILFKPKDIVSGDFYWFGSVEDEKIVVSADCTGHGVPAALMTIMGNDLLNEIVLQDKIIHPDKILEELDRKIINGLSNENGVERQDGMDMSIVTINAKKQRIYFAGAKNPLYIIYKNEIDTIKGSFFPIGSNQYNTKKQFDLHEIRYKKETKIYLFSDGFQDQFGGKLGKKFMKKRFRELIFETRGESMQEQRKILVNEFYDWKKEEDQTDDVIVIGLLLD
ncbi:MAG: SpoIIE family protein phosphatase [Bacteroidota bacterium]|nr:SpoIIE family protein phosphatase [Bacteroidota bacterium]